jgi:hypothetical protein
MAGNGDLIIPMRSPSGKLGARVVVAVVTVMVAGLCERRTSKQQNHGEQQGLFHVQIIATITCPVSTRQVNFRVTSIQAAKSLTG